MPPPFLNSRGPFSSSSSSSSSSSRSSRDRSGSKRSSKSAQHKLSDVRPVRIDIRPSPNDSVQSSLAAAAVPAKWLKRGYVFAVVLLLLLAYGFLFTEQSMQVVKHTETPAEMRVSPADHTSQMQPSESSTGASSGECSPSATEAGCDWSWGASGSANSLEHSREEAEDGNSTSAQWKRPQDFYSYGVQLITIEKQTGALVTISMRDQCCSTASPLPLSYFRVTVIGAAQAASHTPITLGPLLPHSDNADHVRDWASLAETSLNKAQSNVKLDPERIVSTFLQLPDSGFYRLQVRLLHYNASLQMLSETFPEGNTRAYESKERGAIWVNGLLRDEGTGLNSTSFYVQSSSTFANALPLCGSREDETLRSSSKLARSSLPLAGRWVFREPSSASQSENIDFHTIQDETHKDPTWLVTNSVWTPYFCRIDYTASVATSFPASRWLHVMGDSNTKVFFRRFMCPLANGTSLETNPDKFPGKFDPPRLCMWPSSPTNDADESTGAAVASNPTWVATYSHWHYPKPTLLDTLEPDHLWGYRAQCYQFKQDYRKGALVRGWPQCLLAPQSIQSLNAPGVTYFAFGSHCAHLGDSEATHTFLDGDEMYGLVYFRYHAPMFPLTTAINPHIIPSGFARQQRMRNNERIAAVNQLIMNTVRKRRSSFAPQSSVDQNWLPVLDIFSPTHAAYEVLNGDAVHFIEFLYRQQMKWMAHMLAHAPNYQIT